MARYRKVDVRIRADAKFRRLSAPQPNAQTLWFHLLTGQHTSAIPGLSGIGEAAMAEELDWPIEAFRKAFAEVFREGMAKADWKARVVWVPNAIRYNPPESPNVVRSWKTAWDEMPECALKTEAWHALKAFLEGFAKGFQEAFAEACPEPSRKALANQEQEQEQEQEPDHSPSESVAREGEQPAAELIPIDADPDRLTPERLVAIWNEATGGKISKVEPDRRTAIRKAIGRQPDPEFWRRCCAKAAAVKAVEGTGWLTFDWLFGKSSKGLGWNAERMENGSFDWKLAANDTRNARTGSYRAESAPAGAFTGRGDITDEF